VAAIQVSWRRRRRPALSSASAIRAKHETVWSSIGSSGYAPQGGEALAAGWPIASAQHAELELGRGHDRDGDFVGKISQRTAGLAGDED